MRIRVAVLVGVLALAGAACGGDDDPDESTPIAFSLTGEVTSVSGDVIEVRPSGTATGLEDCPATDGVYEISLETAIANDPESFEGEDVTVTGNATRKDTGCELEAQAITADSGDGGTGGDGTGSGAESTGSPAPGGSPGADGTPGPADEGSILDDTPSPEAPAP